MEKIRSGGFDLTRDLPMDADLERRPGERGTEDGFELRLAERGQSRFGDVDVPSRHCSVR